MRQPEPLRMIKNVHIIARQIVGSLIAKTNYRLRHRKIAYKKLTGRGLEIGAMHHPAKLDSSCKVEYCDVISAADAVKHFPEVGKVKFVEVDHLINLDTQNSMRATSGAEMPRMVVRWAYVARGVRA